MTSMAKQIVFLVGDQYGDFAANPHVMKESDFRQRMAANDSDLTRLCVVVGQGMRNEEAVALHRESQATPVTVLPVAEAAPLAVTHKRDTRNILISTPRKIGPLTYAMELVLDDSMDRLSDHVTGQHIGGMLLIEAARQAVIATVEAEYLASRAERFGFLWNSLHVDFMRFAFPLPTSMQVTLREEQAEDRPQVTHVVVVEFTQGGHPVAKTELRIVLAEQRTLTVLETRAARRAIEATKTLCETEKASSSVGVAGDERRA